MSRAFYFSEVSIDLYKSRVGDAPRPGHSIFHVQPDNEIEHTA